MQPPACPALLTAAVASTRSQPLIGLGARSASAVAKRGSGLPHGRLAPSAQSTGRRVWSLQGYAHNGALYFAALFGTAGPATAVSPQNTIGGHEAAMTLYKSAGWDVRAVTGFESSGQARFVGVWAN